MIRPVVRSENRREQVVMWWAESDPLVWVGLTDQAKSGGAGARPPWPPRIRHHHFMMGSQTARWTLLLRSSTSFGLIFSWSLQCMYYVVMLHILAIDASDATVFLHLVQCTELVHWLLMQANGGARILFDPDFRVFSLMVVWQQPGGVVSLNIDEQEMAQTLRRSCSLNRWK